MVSLRDRISVERELSDEQIRLLQTQMMELQEEEETEPVIRKAAPLPTDELVSAPSASLPYPRSQPLLPPPEEVDFSSKRKRQQRTAERELAHSLDAVREEMLSTVAENMTTLNERALDLDGRHRDLMKQMESSCRLLEQQGIWSTLRLVVESLTAAACIGVGAATAPSGVGLCLIGLGVCMLGNAVMRHTGAWDWLAGKIFGEGSKAGMIASLVVSGGLTLICSIAAPALLVTNFAQLSLQIGSQIPTMIQAALLLMQSIFNAGASAGDVRKLIGEAQLTRLQNIATIRHWFAEGSSEMITSLLKEMGMAARITSSTMQGTIRMLRSVTRRRKKRRA